MRKSEKMGLAVFKRKILKRIYGPCISCIDSNTGEWRKQQMPCFGTYESILTTRHNKGN